MSGTAEQTEQVKALVVSLTAEKIKALAGKRRSQTVDIPEWGGQVHVFSMTADQGDRFAEMNFAADPKDARRLVFTRKGYTARVALFTVCDEAGRPLFTEEDLGWLAEMDAAAMKKIVTAAGELGCLGDDSGEDEAKK